MLDFAQNPFNLLNYSKVCTKIIINVLYLLMKVIVYLGALDMTTRRNFLKYLVGLGVGTLLWQNVILPQTAISSSTRTTNTKQHWTKNPQAKLSFVVISDIHIARLNAIRNFSLVLNSNYNSRPDAMIVNGDLGDGLWRDYNTINNELAVHKIEVNYPIHWTIGNHEFYGAFYDYGLWSPKTFPNRETDATAIDRFLRLANRDKVYGDTWINDYHFIFLGSEKSRMSDMSYTDAAFLSDTQLDWLKNALIDNKHPDQPIFVFLHQPIPHTTLGGFQPGYVIQWQKLNAILSQHPEVILFNGHTHYKLDQKHMASKENFAIVNSSSLASPIDRNRKPIMNYAPGLVVEVYKDKVVIKGRDFFTSDWVPGAEITIKAIKNSSRSIKHS
ncbi:MAG TPA: metallophosphoesterase [Desulfosporosinus sp.]|nr:metallophosphoesterase [Desulfosporosinus sp.]